LFFNAANCVGQNKNRFLLAYLMVWTIERRLPSYQLATQNLNPMAALAIWR
jgi:hypothetical protein